MQNLNNIPTTIKIYLIFSLIISSLFPITLFFSREFYEKIVPHIGWNPTTSYMFSLAIAIPILLSKRYTPENIMYKFIYGVIILHLIGIAYGLKAISIVEGNNFNNPYLTISYFRYIWVVIIPVIWIIAFVYQRFKTSINF